MDPIWKEILGIFRPFNWTIILSTDLNLALLLGMILALAPRSIESSTTELLKTFLILTTALSEAGKNLSLAMREKKPSKESSERRKSRKRLIRRSPQRRPRKRLLQSLKILLVLKRQMKKRRKKRLRMLQL